MTQKIPTMQIRPRRNRKSPVIRRLVEETRVTVDDLILPLFLVSGENQQIPVDSMPGISRYSTDRVLDEIATCYDLGIRTFAPFPALPDNVKDPQATESANPDGLFPTAIRTIKSQFPDVCLVTDVAMDPYSSDGHDGLVRDGRILNDESLDILSKMALVQAEAGSRYGGPVRHDGRPGGPHSAHAGRAWLFGGGHHGLHGQVRQRVLRSVP